MTSSKRDNKASLFAEEVYEKIWTAGDVFDQVVCIHISGDVGDFTEFTRYLFTTKTIQKYLQNWLTGVSQ